MYCNACGEATADADATWRSETGNALMYFLGFDNSYFWGVTHLALLMAHEGKYILPHTIVPQRVLRAGKFKILDQPGPPDLGTRSGQ